MKDDLQHLSALELGRLMHDGHVSPVEVVDSALARIDETDSAYNAFISRTDDEARAAAREAETEIRRGDIRSPLHGVPLAVKDNIAAAGTVTTGGTAFLSNNVTAEDAEAVRRLREAGAIVVGKTNLHELAFGSTTINPHYGTTRNPWNLDHIAGGSSGGSAAALAGGQVALALGTDHAGSIRIPASLCNVVGLKPTHGRVSARGLAGSRNVTADHVGPMARTVADTAAMLDVIAGYDPQDPLSIKQEAPSFSDALRDGALVGTRVGVPENFYFDVLDPTVEQAVRTAIDELERLGAELVDVRVPDLGQMIAVRVALGAEGLAFADQYLRTVPEQFSTELRRTLLALYFVTARDLARANRVRRLLVEEFDAVFNDVNLIAAPTTATAAFPIDARLVQFRDARTDEDVAVPAGRSLITLTWPTNLTGMPAISVPCGFTPGGLPVGLQLIGRAFDDARVVAAAHAYEQSQTWVTRWPDASLLRQQPDKQGE